MIFLPLQYVKEACRIAKQRLDASVANSPMICGTLLSCAELERYAPEPEGENFIPYLSELDYLIHEQMADDGNDDWLVCKIAENGMYQDEANRVLDEVDGKPGRALYDLSVENVKHETPSYAFTQNLCAMAKHGMTRLREAKDTFSRDIVEKLQEEYALEDDQEFVYPEHYGESIDRAMQRPYSEKLYRMESQSKKLRTCLQRIERVIWSIAGIGEAEENRLYSARMQYAMKKAFREKGKAAFAKAWGNSLTSRTFYEVKAAPDNKKCLNSTNGCPVRCKLGKDGYC